MEPHLSALDLSDLAEVTKPAETSFLASSELDFSQPNLLSKA